MKLLKLCSFALAVVLASVAFQPARVARATHPDLLRHYRFLPHHSVLTQEWTDREAPTIPIPISGTFDLLTGFNHELYHDPDPWVGQYAKFENVHAGGPHPIQDYIVDLDQVLNLSGLTGRQLPAAFVGTLFGFDGRTADGSNVHLLVSLGAPWLRIRGETTPPEGSSLKYSINAIARQRPFADFNDDGVVDGADLAVLTANLDASLETADGDVTHLGDADGDHIVDGADFLAWQRQFGEEAPPVESLDAMTDAAIASLSASVAAVPEPGSLGLLTAGALVLFGCRRRR